MIQLTDSDDHGSTAPLAPRTAALVRTIRLEVVDGPDRGRVFASTGERTVIGTKSSADVILTDAAVSRYHCALTLRGSRVEVEDLDSKNGTAIDGIAIATAWLDREATLEIGQSRVRVALGEDMVEVAVSEREQFGEMHGSSRAMRAVFALCERAAASDATVLLQGETGTGKDAAAMSIHLESERRDGPFVVVDCGSIPPGLVESHLFGHEAGAFTGATRTRAGVFESAHGGTVFLDEIGELSLDLQPKLLRALEARTVRRVGSTEDIAVDVRVIAATNRDLQREVNAQRFRSDLYYRLAVIEIRIPPLRQRRDDIPGLVEHLLEDIGATGPAAAQLQSKRALDAIARQPWPGNVRELRNYLERSVVLAEPAPLERADGAELTSDPARDEVRIDPAEPLRVARDRVLRDFERRYLLALLREHGGNVSRAARAAGVARIHFYRLMARAGIAAHRQSPPSAR